MRAGGPLSEAWWFLFAGCIYVCCHFALYLTLVRHSSVLRQEREIFLYHSSSFAALLLAASVACVVTTSTAMVKAAFGALSLHAIYSISFLEAWSLSQISYSIAILDAIETTPGLDVAGATQKFAETGNAKKASRLASLQRLGLIVIRHGQAALAPRGQAVAGVLALLRWIANLRDTG